MQDIAAQDRAAAGIRREQAEQDLEQRRFAGAVVADQSDHAGLERHADVAQRPHLAVTATDVVDVDKMHQ